MATYVGGTMLMFYSGSSRYGYFNSG